MPSAVNVLTNTPKISSNTMGDILQINFPENDENHDTSPLMEHSQLLGKPSHIDFQCVF